MGDRLKKRDDFVKKIGWNDAVQVKVAGDASNRSYERLTKSDGRCAILMNSPPEKGEDVQPFIHILTHLRKICLEAPELYASDVKNGFLLLEDLGDCLFAKVCEKSPALEQDLYLAAMETLLHLHRSVAPDYVAPYDLKAYLRETDLVTDWYFPGITGQPPAPALAAEFQAIITSVCKAINGAQSVLVLRDYHAENLLWLPERHGVRNVGLLDFQDALMGHPAYDLVSLLEDARRDTSLKLQAEIKTRFIEKSGADPVAFNYAYDAIGAQRNLKIIGIFARLSIRDAKPHYIDMIPRVWAHLDRDLSHPDLVELRQWVDVNLPKPTPENLARIKGARNIA